METAEKDSKFLSSWQDAVMVLLAALIALKAAAVASALASVLKKFMKPADDPQLIQMRVKVRKTKVELDAIPPTSQFAAYCKKKREFDKLGDELSAMESKASNLSNANVKLDVVVRVVVQALGLLLLQQISSITAFCVPSNVIWPFNFFIRFPAIFGNDSCPEEFSEVSAFMVAYFAIVFLTNIRESFNARFGVGTNKIKTN